MIDWLIKISDPTFFSDRWKNVAMATNFYGKIGKIGLLIFIRGPGISGRIGISQFRFQKIQWQWFRYIACKFGEIRSSNPGVYENRPRIAYTRALVDQQWSYFIATFAWRRRCLALRRSVVSFVGRSALSFLSPLRQSPGATLLSRSAYTLGSATHFLVA